jgi:receptor protein-tyrosine kinase
MHLIERAADALGEADHSVAADLLRNQGAAPRASDPPQARRGAAPVPPPEAAPSPPAQDAPAAVPVVRARIEAAALLGAGMIDWTKSRDRPAEEFRIVQTQLLQAMATKPAAPPALANLVMVTSAKPGEGKTFCAMNIAGSGASAGQRPVILIDIDIKRRSLSRRLGIDQCAGLLDLAANPRQACDDIVLPTALPNLRVVPAGLGASDDALSAAHPILGALERIGHRYPDHLIVLDAPPCLSTSDPSTLAPLVGQIVMLVEAQQTQRAEVEAALDLVEACPAIMLMLNKLQLTGSDTFGAYGY